MSGFAPIKFVPIYDIEDYLSSAKITGEPAETLRKLHTPPQKAKAPKPLYTPHVTRWDQGYFEDGKIIYPYEEAWPYLRKNDIVPFDIRLRCAIRNGIPLAKVESFIAKRKKYESAAEVQKRDDEWHRLFGK